ncbi:MAG: DUF2889 domain-containing protein [Desulfobacterales bacterium]
MGLDNQYKGRKIHARNIEISTYEYDDEYIVVEGELKEDALIAIYISGEKHQPHTVHHMIIRMLIECSSLTIKEINVEMPGIPYDECIETSNSLDMIKGMRISPGFTSKVKKSLKGNKRCVHLTTLLLAMAPAAMQGFWVYSGREPGGNGVSSDMIKGYLIDSCWVWRRDGELVSWLKQKRK